MVVLKGLIFNNVYFGRKWQSYDGFWTIITLQGGGSFKRTDFLKFPLWEGIVVL